MKYGATVGVKEKRATDEQKAAGCGDCWTWTAIDAESKLIVSYLVGDRGPYNCYEFMKDVARASGETACSSRRTD